MQRSPATDRSSWSAIRDAAFQVVLLTRRKEGLWALPTHERDLDPYAPEDTREIRDREEQDFGHPSITVSFNALLALASVTDEWPPLLSAETLEVLKDCRSSGGGYGSPAPRKDGIEPNAVPRHTAMAIVLQLLFSRQSPPDIAAVVEPAVRWLLGNRNSKSGWSYSWEKRPALGYHSTVASICALCLFLDLGRARTAPLGKIETAIREAYQALLDLRENSVWDGDGVPAHNQVRDSAFALRMLLLGDRSGTLTRLMPHGAPTVTQLIANYSRDVVEGGWPARLGGGTFSVPAAISALHLIGEAGNPAGIPDGELAAARGAILADWREGGFGHRLTAWDWQCAALLSTQLAGPIPLATGRAQADRCAELRKLWRHAALQSTDLDQIAAEAKPALLFALTGGLGFSAPAEPPRKSARSVLGLLRRADELTAKPVDRLAAWYGAIGAVGAIIVGGGVIWSMISNHNPPTPDRPPVPVRVKETVPTPAPPPPPPPRARTECTSAERADAFEILHRSIESDLTTYMYRPGQFLPMLGQCRLSGDRYEIIYKLDVIGSLCGRDRLRYEARYSGAWPVDGTRVQLRRIGPEFERLRRQKREMRANPFNIPTCPRE